jgi:hypothetical protein
LEGDEYRGRIYRDETGDLVMRVYLPTVIPLEWLLEIAKGAKQDLPR